METSALLHLSSMFKAYLKYLLLLIIITPGKVIAQSSELFSIRKYPAFETAADVIAETNRTDKVKPDTINLLVTDQRDVMKIIDAGLSNKVFTIELLNASRPNLDTIFGLLARLPKLGYLKINDYNYAHTNIETYVLPASIQGLINLKELEFAYTDKIDMDDALKKLLPMQRLHKLVFTEYEHQLPVTLTRLKQLTSINISTENIGDMDISGVNWQSAEVKGYHIRAGRTPYLKDGGKPQADGLVNLSKVKKLRDLHIWLYQLSDTSVLSKFTRLKSLDIDGTLHQTPTFFTPINKLTNLKKLSLSFLNRDSVIVRLGGLRDMTGLNELSIVVDGVETPAVLELEVLGKFKNLKTLTLRYMNIGALPDIFYKMPHLKHLSLGFNNITSVPLNLFNLPSLVDLELTGNRLTQLPFAQQYGCRQLKTLELNANRLGEFPPAITRLPNIETISATDNELTDAADGWQNLKHLKQVDFARNKLKELPAGLQDNRSVEWISLHENKLTKLPDAKVGKYNLKFLTLSGNPLRTAAESK